MTRKELQQLEFDVLCSFQDICERAGLRFFLTAGTLLGAARHAGFIPWDDDVDVVMPRDDYDRFIQLDFSATGLVCLNMASDKSYPHCFAKLKKIDGPQVCDPILTGNSGVGIDIFPLDGLPNGKIRAKLCFYRVQIYTNALMWKRYHNMGYRKVFARILARIFALLPDKLLCRCRQRLITRGNTGKPAKLCTYGGRHGFRAESYPANWFANTKRLDFEKRSFPVPGEYELLLDNMYGNWHQIVKEDEHFCAKDE